MTGALGGFAMLQGIKRAGIVAGGGADRLKVGRLLHFSGRELPRRTIRRTSSIWVPQNRVAYGSLAFLEYYRDTP